MSLFFIRIEKMILNKFNIITIGLISCLLLFSWLTPNHYMPWLTSHSDFSVFLAVLCGIVYLYGNKISCQFPVILFALVIFSLIPIMHWIFRERIFFGEALISSFYILGFIIAVLLGYNFKKYNKLENNIYIFFLFFINF